MKTAVNKDPVSVRVLVFSRSLRSEPFGELACFRVARDNNVEYPLQPLLWCIQRRVRDIAFFLLGEIIIGCNFIKLPLLTSPSASGGYTAIRRPGSPVLGVPLQMINEVLNVKTFQIIVE